MFKSGSNRRRGKEGGRERGKLIMRALKMAYVPNKALRGVFIK
jgi:hypothetical protein